MKTQAHCTGSARSIDFFFHNVPVKLRSFTLFHILKMCIRFLTFNFNALLKQLVSKHNLEIRVICFTTKAHNTSN